MPKKKHNRFRSSTLLVTKPRHKATMAAVREFCLCGARMDDKTVHAIPPVSRHRKVRLIFPPTRDEPALLQVGIDPDGPDTRDLVTKTLGWSWVDRICDGVWNIRPPREWGIDVDLDATLTDGETEVRVVVEWP